MFYSYNTQTNSESSQSYYKFNVTVKAINQLSMRMPIVAKTKQEATEKAITVLKNLSALTPEQSRAIYETTTLTNTQWEVYDTFFMTSPAISGLLSVTEEKPTGSPHSSEFDSLTLYSSEKYVGGCQYYRENLSLPPNEFSTFLERATKVDQIRQSPKPRPPTQRELYNTIADFFANQAPALKENAFVHQAVKNMVTLHEKGEYGYSPYAAALLKFYGNLVTNGVPESLVTNFGNQARMLIDNTHNPALLDSLSEKLLKLYNKCGSTISVNRFYEKVGEKYTKVLNAYLDTLPSVQGNNSLKPKVK